VLHTGWHPDTLPSRSEVQQTAASLPIPAPAQGGDVSDEGHNDTQDAIELDKAVQAIRDGLIAAARQAAEEDLTFELGDIQMEFTVELRKELKGGGKVKAWVLEAGADATRTSARTQKVVFTLKPKDNRTGAPWKVGNENQGSIAGFGSR
jgi:hypothetical protein